MSKDLRTALASLPEGPAADLAFAAFAALLRAVVATNDTEEADPSAAFAELRETMLGLSDQLATGDESLAELLAAS